MCSRGTYPAIGVNYDLTEQKNIQAELDRLAYFDRLTGLPNLTAIGRPSFAGNCPRRTIAPETRAVVHRSRQVQTGQ